MRTDLGMGKGKMVAQGAHATSRSTRRVHQENRFLPWLAEGEPKVVLKVSSKEELQFLIKKAGAAKLNTGFIIDAGKTEFKEPTMTCGWIGPDTDERINPITKDLKLL